MNGSKKTKKKSPRGKGHAGPLTIDVASLRESAIQICPVTDIEGRWYRQQGTSHDAAILHKRLWKVVRIDKGDAGNPTKVWVQGYGKSKPTSVRPYLEVHPYRHSS